MLEAILSMLTSSFLFTFFSITLRMPGIDDPSSTCFCKRMMVSSLPPLCRSLPFVAVKLSCNLHWSKSFVHEVRVGGSMGRWTHDLLSVDPANAEIVHGHMTELLCRTCMASS